MSKMLDLLLGAGDEILERPTETLEVSRLSEKLGERFTVTIRALSLREIEDFKPGEDRLAYVILAGATDPDFSSEALRKKFTPAGRKTPLTPVELIKTLLLPGEIFNLYTAIMGLSGYSDDAVARIEKN